MHRGPEAGRLVLGGGLFSLGGGGNCLGKRASDGGKGERKAGWRVP